MRASTAVAVAAGAVLGVLGAIAWGMQQLIRDAVRGDDWDDWQHDDLDDELFDLINESEYERGYDEGYDDGFEDAYSDSEGGE